MRGDGIGKGLQVITAFQHPRDRQLADRHPQVGRQFLKLRNLEVVAQLQELASDLGVTISQLAIARALSCR
ncbi:hypothetical protein MAHJHV63_50730 [Mycobacterium avium subsp. hominissuis]